MRASPLPRRCTLLYQQVSTQELIAATQTALRNLQRKRLIQQLEEVRGLIPAPLPNLPSFALPPQARRSYVEAVLQPYRWVPTRMGQAVYDSSLPPHAGMELFNRWGPCRITNIMLHPYGNGVRGHLSDLP